MIFDKSHVLINKNFSTKEELFDYLGKLAKSKKITQNSEVVSDAFSKRESEGTTGFEDGFAIPHARVEGVDVPSLFIIRNKANFKNWEALDGNGVKYAIALMIPKNAGSLHMDILSSIATKLIDANFRDIVKTGDDKSIFKAFNDFLKDIINRENSKREEPKISTNSKKDLLIGISACPAGIAHTFMAKQKMEDAAKELNMDIKWETQGANGQKNALTKTDINKASAIIIASDIELDLDRFIGKKIIITNTNDAIKNGSKLVIRALEVKNEFKGESNNHKNPALAFLSLMRRSFQSSFGKPWVYMSITGSLLAIIALVGFSMYGQSWTKNGMSLNENLFKIQEIAKFALYLSMPIMAATVAKKMINRNEVFALVFISCLLLNMPAYTNGWNTITGETQNAINIFFDWNFFHKTINHGSNIIGALVTTFTVVLTVKILRKFMNFLDKRKSNYFFKGIRMSSSPWINILVPAGIALLVIVFLFGAPLSFASSKMTFALVTYAHDYWWLRLIIGGSLGLMIASDLGGIINKIGLISLIGLAQYDLRFAAIIPIGIPLASIGYGTSCSFYKNKFKEEDAKDAKLSFRKGLNGMTEGPLFLTNKYGWRVMLPNLLATFIATGLSLVIGLYIFKGGHVGVLFMGAQADLSHPNDLDFLSKLLPNDEGIITAICSIAYGIIGYYLVMLMGSLSYVGISGITFSIPGAKKVFK